MFKLIQDYEKSNYQNEMSQTRGFSKKEAKALLTYAFTIDALEKISIPFVQDFGKKIFAEKLNTAIQFDDLC